jgi:hypothetical protein
MANTPGHFPELGELQGTGIISTVIPGFNDRGSIKIEFGSLPAEPPFSIQGMSKEVICQRSPS